MLWLIGASDIVWILPVSASQRLMEGAISHYTNYNKILTVGDFSLHIDNTNDLRATCLY